MSHDLLRQLAVQVGESAALTPELQQAAKQAEHAIRAACAALQGCEEELNSLDAKVGVDVHGQGFGGVLLCMQAVVHVWW
jgi:hypothetical protein